MAAALAFPPKTAPAVPDYFAVFGLKRLFALDRTRLERKFYELSRNTHPDRFAASGVDTQHQALVRMSELNEAYSTLKDSQRLREYYLELEGFTLSSEKPAIPMELAEGWFELQDALTDDPTSARAKITEFERELADLKAKSGETLLSIEKSIDQAVLAQNVAPRELLEKLAKEIQAQSYFKSLERDVERIKHAN